MPALQPLPTTRPDVAAFLEKSRIPRARAAKKLEDVLRRAAAGTPALDRIREIWLFGSFARGAVTVGDVDLHVRIDDSRDQNQFRTDSFWNRTKQFGDHERALGCSGSSFVNIQFEPVFKERREPVSPERLTAAGNDGSRLPARPPDLVHVVTLEPLAGPFVLLSARGDRMEWALERVRAIPEAPGAGRHDRTTTVSLLDDLTPKLGLEISFALAAHVRRRTLGCRAVLLDAADPPTASRRALAVRYDAWDRSSRGPAAAAALAFLEREGTDLRDVALVGTPATESGRDPRVFIDFNAFQLYRAAAGSYDTGDRLLQVWPAAAPGHGLRIDGNPEPLRDPRANPERDRAVAAVGVPSIGLQ